MTLRPPVTQLPTAWTPARPISVRRRPCPARGHRAGPRRSPGLRWVAIGIGALFGLGLVSSALSSGDGGASTDAGYSQSSGGSGGSSQIYSSGSVTTTDDGEVIYSDNSGNGFSSGG